MPVPGVPDVLLDLAADRLLKVRGDDRRTYLDWAPHLTAWWTDADGVPVYRVRVKDQTEDVTPETLRDGTAWDLFDHAAGHDVRTVREALAGCVKWQRRNLPKAPGLSALGWHEVDGRPVYVSADACFGPEGEVTATVHAYDADEAALPPAPTGDRRRQVVALSLSVLEAAVLRVSAPAMCCVWLAPLISLFGNDLPRFVGWMWSDGRAQVFGVLKSSLAAVLQAHSGTGYRGESDLLPAADTTLPALSGVLGVRKDGLVIVDDYKPGETSSVDAKTQTVAEQGIRAATNRQKRAKARMKTPGRAKVAACMAQLFYTAECLPLFNSGSTHDRTFPFQVHKGDVHSDRLTVLQDRVDELPEAGAAYAAWLAVNHDEVSAFLVQRFRELRADLRQGQEVTGRACSHIAHMLCAAETFTRFAVDCGALEPGRRTELLADVRAALIETASATVTERAEDQPHEVWLRNLRGLFAGGKLYAIDPTGTGEDGRPTYYPDALGWATDRMRRDTLAGYATPEGLAVVESEATPEIQRRDKSLTIGGLQLRRLLAARGVIRPFEPDKDGKHEHQKRVRVGGRLPWCVLVPWDVFLGTGADGGQEDEQGPADGGPADGGPADGPGPAPEGCRGCGGPWYGGEADPSGYHPGCDPAVQPDRTADGQTVKGEALPCVQCGQPTPYRADGQPRHLGGLCQPAPATLDTVAAEAGTEQGPAVRQTDDVPGRSNVNQSSRPGRTTGSEAPARPARAQSVSAGTAIRSRGVTPSAGPHAAVLEAAEARKSIRTAAQREALAERLALLDDPEIGERPDRLRLLAALEGGRGVHGPFAPRRHRQGPWWQAAMPGMVEAVQVMNGWDWEREDFTGEAVVLDRNGSWPTAVSSVAVAHGALEHTGPMDEVRGATAPGYYKVTVYPWTEAGLPSPLGNEPIGSERWITGTRMRLLADLAEAGRWPDASALDSYTGEPVRLHSWAHLVGELRRYALQVHGRESGAYDAVKEAFGQAMGLLHGSWDEEGGAVGRRVFKCKARRVDWAHHIKDQASATVWRTADACLRLAPEAGPVALRNVDELLIPSAALEAVTAEDAEGKAVVRLDDLGTEFGTWKVKDREEWGE